MSAAPASPSVRNGYLDTLRGWSILGVVGVHFAGSFVTADVHAWSPSFWLGLSINQLFGFAVPLFIFLSGLLAGLSKASPGLWDYYRTRLWRIGFPYLLASAASFFFLNHYAQWLNEAGLKAKLVWLFQHLAFFGVEPTLYFIPLILQLYFLQPFLKSLPGWLHRLAPGMSLTAITRAVAALLLLAHVIIGLKCYHGSLNYYVWARPNALFWAFYFFAGLHLPALAAGLAPRTMKILAGLGFAAAAAAMAWNGLNLSNREIVGASFELNRLDFAYARPEMLVYDAAVVLLLATGVILRWTTRPNPMSYLGRYTLEIYLWHILALYYGAWRYGDVIASCRAVPELIVLICLAAAFALAGLTDGWERLKAFVHTHRLVVQRVA